MEDSALEQKPPKKTAAQQLYELTGSWELFHDDGGTAYVRVPTPYSPLQTWPVKSAETRDHLKLLALQAGKIAHRSVVDSVMDTLDGKARFLSARHNVSVRVASTSDALYLDLCDPQWQVVRIDAAGWRVDPNPPVRFIRKRGMLALPVPMPGGSIDDLRPLVNGRDEATWKLMVAWLLSTLQPKGPYPCLLLYGGEGCLKTGTSLLLRSIVDPNKVPLRDLPSTARDLAIAGTNSRILAFDNVSKLTPTMSDALCRIATGGGFATRELYSDTSEVLLEMERPVLANGIERFATRPDLIDRALLLDLPPVADHERLPKSQVDARFADAHPRILGALLDAVSGSIRNLPAVNLTHQPRMADFVCWVTAAEPALGWESGSFLCLYEAHLQQGIDDALDADVVFPVLVELLAPAPQWRGTVGRLLGEVRRYWTVRDAAPGGLPRSVQELSGRLKRMAKTLLNAGIVIERPPRTGDERPIILRRSPSACSQEAA